MLGICFYAYAQIVPAVLWKRSRFHQILAIAEAVRTYSRTNSIPPRSLEELVNAKVLPVSSDLYASAIRYKSLTPPAVHYHQSDYFLYDGTNCIIISLKSEVFQQVATAYPFFNFKPQLFREIIDYER
jgi:hypothetical protein